MITKRLLGLAALTLALATPACAQTLYWYDGTVRRPLTVEAGAATTKGEDVVLRDAGGASRSLPGGVVVTLRGTPTESQARQELAAAGLQPVRAVGAGAKVWLVAAPAGMAALELANRLHESGRFEAVQPNWKEERVKK